MSGRSIDIKHNRVGIISALRILLGGSGELESKLGNEKMKDYFYLNCLRGVGDTMKEWGGFF